MHQVRAIARHSGRDTMEIKGFEIVKQGAEARLFKGTYLGRPALIKERFVKKYRHPDLDTLLTKDRTKGEARAIVRAKAAGVKTPALFLVDFDRRRIYMEYINDAITLKDYIDSNISDKENVGCLISFIAEQVGSAVARLHSRNIIHGDLTTSNMLLKNYPVSQRERTGEKDEKNNFEGEIILIDFGLAHVESTAEDKAVDLYVLERALLSAHSEVPSLFPEMLQFYQKFCTSKDKRDVIAKYKEVQARGRKRLMIG
ncbi:EKC/KEOPS complex subunit Tp53rk isoform X2 [Neodiprion fabricii]|uniref:EKC/KEOPS complex subunit Tp53rk isoform X2 n=1 Tax=Neodiprion fabricii TaxID=2872261 RepID=UPI001ED97E32|nr:EKC/KEOPS complex subunit Tp53rk isoform X2 [Neodiprion fabricii]